MKNTVNSGFLMSVKNYPDEPALEVADNIYSYKDLLNFSVPITNSIKDGDAGSGIIGIFSGNNLTSYTGVISILNAGKGYLSLDVEDPEQLIVQMIKDAGIKTLIVSLRSQRKLKRVLECLETSLKIIGPEIDGFLNLPNLFPDCSFVVKKDLREESAKLEVVATKSSDIAYLTYKFDKEGNLKGIPLTHENLISSVSPMTESLELSSSDRVLQTSPFQVNLSVLGMFMTWWSGACLCLPSSRKEETIKDVLLKGKITVFISLPSIIGFMRRKEILEPDTYPDLRCTVFRGGSLPILAAKGWQSAAPNTKIINLYGEPETSFVASFYEYNEAEDGAQEEGALPVGKALSNCNVAFVKPDGSPAENNERGELYISGAAVFSGYKNDEENKGDYILILEDKGDTLWYKTGDVFKCSEGVLSSAGYAGSQTKINGVKVDLSAIEKILQEAAGLENVAAVPWPRTPFGPRGIVGFIANEDEDYKYEPKKIFDFCRKRMPKNMIPQRLMRAKTIPVTQNGSINRRALVAFLERRTAEKRKEEQDKKEAEEISAQLH
ncbi:MAG: AMP-binding protein [Alphaproteobacteria bacterium]